MRQKLEEQKKALQKFADDFHSVVDNHMASRGLKLYCAETENWALAEILRLELLELGISIINPIDKLCDPPTVREK